MSTTCLENGGESAFKTSTPSSRRRGGEPPPRAPGARAALTCVGLVVADESLGEEAHDHGCGGKRGDQPKGSDEAATPRPSRGPGGRGTPSLRRRRGRPRGRDLPPRPRVSGRCAAHLRRPGGPRGAGRAGRSGVPAAPRRPRRAHSPLLPTRPAPSTASLTPLGSRASEAASGMGASSRCADMPGGRGQRASRARGPPRCRRGRF